MPRKKRPIEEFPIKIRHARLEDIPKIERIVRHYPDEFGFVMRVSLIEALERKTLYVADYWNDPCVGFVHFRSRKDGWNTIYNIGVHQDFTKKRIGSFLLNAISTPIQLKCTVDNDKANQFYAHNAFVLDSVEEGRKRPLNVWKKKYLNIFCQGSNQFIPEIAYNSGMMYGTRHCESPVEQPFFVDINWKNYEWEDYLNKLKHWKPVMAMVPDFLDITQKKDLYKKIRQLKELGIMKIMVCPKFNGAIQYIPSFCTIAVSIPSRYAGFLPDPKELENRKIHLLGGSPQKQVKYIRDHPNLNILSVDGNAIAKNARWGVHYGERNKWEKAENTVWKERGYYGTVEESAKNIIKGFQRL